MSYRTAADRRSAFHRQSLKFQLKRRILIAAPGAYASALLFVQLRVGFIRRRLGFGALGLAQRSFLVSLSLFLLAPSTCRPRSLGSLSSVIWLKCHCVLAGLLRTCRRYISTSRCHRSAICAHQIHEDGDNRDRMATRQERIDAFTHQRVPPADSRLNFFARITSARMSFRFCADGVAMLGTVWIPAAQSKRRSSAGACVDGN